jgi:hypothetical protein
VRSIQYPWLQPFLPRRWLTVASKHSTAANGDRHPRQHSIEASATIAFVAQLTLEFLVLAPASEQDQAAEEVLECDALLRAAARREDVLEHKWS